MITGDHLGAHQYYSASPTLNLFNFLFGVQTYDLEGLIIHDLVDYYYTEELIRLYSCV